MGIEDEIDQLREIVQNLCPHRNVKIEKSSYGNTYSCNLCKKRSVHNNLAEFRKNSDELYFY